MNCAFSGSSGTASEAGKMQQNAALLYKINRIDNQRLCPSPNVRSYLVKLVNIQSIYFKIMNYALLYKIVFENVIHSKSVLLLPRQIGNDEHSREICMISASKSLKSRKALPSHIKTKPELRTRNGNQEAVQHKC